MKKAFSRSLSCLLSVVMLFGIFVITDVEINATAYNAQAAVNYAKKYWSNYNPDYPNCNSIGGDCANFVSQCLYAGGLQQDSEWKVGSAAWQACPSMYNYFDRKGYTIIDYASASDIKLGNPVLYWNADKGRWSHAAICTGFNGSTPLVSAHNNDRCDVDWKLGGSAYWGSDRRATILINDGSVPYIDIGTNFYAYIINNGAWKMATVKSDDVKLYPETAFRDQIWYFERQDDKSYKITNIQTGKCLDVQDGGNLDGSNVLAWNSNDGNNQRWYFSGVQGDCYIIPKNAPSKALDLAGGATGDGTNIQIWTQNGTAAQKFHIWKFDNKPNKPTVTSSSDKYAVGSNVKVSWGENAFATSYWVDVWHNNQHTESFGINDTSYTVKNVTAGEYTVFVASCNPNGASETGAFTFNVPTYTISYNMNGGSGSIGNQTKIYGQDLTLSSTKPTRTGYDFLGWNTNKDATTAQYSAGGKYTANSGATLYAIWKINTWTVSYNMNGGSGSIGNQTKTYNQDLTLSSTKPTRTGYDFVGWNTNASATTAQYSAGGKYTANSGATLYAIWKINTWTVSYNMNGGSGSIGNQTKTYGQDLTLSSTKPTRTGYDFVGWNTNASATTAQYSAGGKYTANSGATLYAIWKKIDENLGTYKYANPNKTTLYARISYNGTDKYLTNLSDNASNDKSYKNVQLKTKNDTLQQVWEFEKLSDGGYKISSIYDGRILDIYNTKTDNGTNIGACGTYYANGGQIWYLIKKDGKYVIQPKVSTGVYLGVANTNDGGNVQLTTSSHLFNIEILKPVGTSTMKAVQEGTSTSPTKFTWTAATDATWYNLYIYDGEVWKSNCIYGQKNIKGLEWSVQLKPGTYQAHLSPVNIHNWTNSNVVSFTVKADTYTISYNMNGGSGSIANQTKTYGQDLTLSSTKPTRTGYDFVGWNTNKDATTAQYSAGGKYTANSGATLYAIWKDSSQPTITNATITKVSSKGYRVNCNVSDNVGITKVQIKVWTEKNGQDDVVLHDGSVSNGLVTAYIETSKHNNETGNYITEIYAYDNAGNSNVVKANNIFVSNEPQKIKTIDYNNHTYIVYVADKSWTDAKTWCEQNDGYLVTVADEAEWNKVKELLGGINGAPAWLGAESTSGSWKWVTGESLTFSNWIQGQPDNAGKKEFYLSTAYEGLNCYGWNDWENSVSQVGAFVYERANTYTISYNMNGGSGSIANQTKTYGVDLTLSSTKPTRTGYDFVGWNTNASATTAQYSAGGKYTANSGATLYAIWKIQAPAAKAVVTNLNEIYNAGQDLTITWNKVDRASSYWINVWRNSGNESSKIVNTEVTTNSYQLNKLATGKYGIVIYAKNESGNTESELYNFYVPFTIKYDMNGGTGTISPTYKKLDIECTLNNAIPTKTDYKFIGWNTDKNATTAQYQAGSKYTANGDTTLYAIWTISHDYTTKVVAPTCTEKGYTLHACKNCNDSYKDTYTNALGHDYKLTSEKVATCTTDGEKIYTCSRCGDKKTETVKATGHNYTTKVVAPTCTAKGYTLHTCKNCNDSYKDTYTNALGHDYKLTNEKAATCTTDGEKVYTCSRCGETKTETVKATGHSYTTKVIAPTCTAKGYTLHTCSKCGDSYKDTYTNATGHKYEETIVAPTTTEQGYTLHTCSVCGDSYKDNYTDKLVEQLVNDSVLSAETIKLGETITATGSAIGGTGSYQYNILYKQTAQTKWTTVQSYKANATVTIKPTKATTYDVCVKVKDSNGTEVKKYFTVKVTDVLKNNSTLSKTEITLGDTITVNGKATGGSGSYQYNILYKQTAQSKWTTVQSYKANATVTIKPTKATTYDVCVKVKDGNGTEVKEYFTVNVTNNELKNISTISAETINLGESVTVNAKATGSTGFYTYAVYYKKTSDTKWTTAQDFKANNKVAVTPTKATTYDICVKVKDDKGTIDKKYFTVNVTSNELKNISTVSAETINIGESVTINAKETGSTGFYTYAVYYKKTSDTKWTTVQDFKANNKITVNLTKAATYDICVKVKDDKGTIDKKYFTVNVTDFANTSELSATEIELGNTIEISCMATGSTGFYQYAVYYKKTADTKWTMKQNYSSNNSVTFKPTEATTYDICVKVKDNQDNIVKRYFEVTVK